MCSSDLGHRNSNGRIGSRRLAYCAVVITAALIYGTALGRAEIVPPQSSITPITDSGDRRSGVALYVGKYSSDVFTDIVGSPWDTKFENIHLLSGTYSYRIAKLLEGVDLEIETGVGKRFGNNTSWEAFAAIVTRFHQFPWNDVVKTTFAVSLLGPSYVENLSRTEIAKDNRNAHWLNYFALELTLALPQAPQYETFIKLHHRSGMFGLIGGSENGADFLSIGGRYRF